MLNSAEELKNHLQKHGDRLHEAGLGRFIEHGLEEKQIAVSYTKVPKDSELAILEEGL